MKKFVAMVLALVMMLSFVPHGIMANANAVGNNNFEVSVFWYDFADAYLSQVRNALDEDLTRAGFSFTNYDAAHSQATQNDQIDVAIAQGTDLLIVNIVDTGAIDASQKIVNKAKAAGLPIIFFNREVDDFVLNSYKNSCFVGVRPAEAGELQGVMAGNYIIENYDEVDLNNDGNISYIMMKGELGNPEAEVRTSESVRFTNAILNEVGKPPLKYYDSRNPDRFQPGNWSKTTAFELMETALSTNPMDSNNPIEVVFANCDDMALGCIYALNNAGWNTGSGNSIPVFGVDCTRDAVEAIKDNKMTGTILQSFENLADTVTTLAKNAANGKNIFDGANEMFYVDDQSAKIRVPYEIVTKDTDNYPEYPSYPLYPDYPYYPEISDFHASVFWYDYSDAFLYDVRNSLDEQLTSWGISNFTNFDAAGNQVIQNDQIDDAIAQGTDILIVNIVDAADITAALKIVNKAKAAWIPVIFFNREVPDVVLKTYSEACYVGTNEADAGELQGMMAGQYIVDNYGEIDINNDGTISYIMMKGELGNPVADMRTQYSVENANMVLEAHGYPTLKYYDPNNADRFQPSNWSKTTAFEFMEAALSTNPMDGNNPIEVVFTNCDDMAIGCIYALNNAGWNNGYSSKSIPVFGFDGTNDAFNAIASDQMTGTVFMSTYDIAFTIAWLADNTHIGLPVFNGAENAFNVDDGVNKVRVPYSFYGFGYPDYTLPDFELPEINEGDVAVFWYDFSDAFLYNVRYDLNNMLENSDVSFVNFNAKCNQEVQNIQIDYAIEQGASLLVVNIVDTASYDAAQNIADKAKAAGIPIIFFNREISDDVINSYENACFVGTRASEASELQGIMAGQYILENYDAVDLNGDGKISYIMMKGELGNPLAESRTSESIKFANAILNEAGKPSLKYYDKSNRDLFQPGNWSKTNAFELMETALSTNPMGSNNPIEVVFANCDDMALGCIEALNNSGWNTGIGKSIPVFGIDCIVEAVDAIKAGKMTGTIYQSSFGIADTIKTLIENVDEGRHVFAYANLLYNVDKGVDKIRVPYEIVTKDTNNYPEYPDFPDYPYYPEAPEFPSMIKGDVNGDYTVSNADLILTARYIVELEDELPRAANADIDGNGIITNSDLIEIALIIVSGSEPVDVVAGVFWYDFSDAYLSTVRDALDEDLFKAGINFINYDAAGNQPTQFDQIAQALSQGVNLLIVNIVDTAAIDAAQYIVNMAKAYGVPVIFFNREVDDYVINSYTNACFVGTRAAEAGEMQGQMAGEYIVANYDAIDLNKDGKISYIMMKGELGNPEAEARTEYSVEVANDILNEAGKPDLVYYDPYNTDCFQPSNWSKNTAFELMETALSTNPMDSKNPIEVVFANNDDAALGCIEALNNAGWNKGYGGKSIPVFGIDYTADARIAIDTGKMTGSILQSANGIAYTINALVSNVADGKHVFADAEDNFNVDRGAAKIRVPYEIKA